MALRRRKDDFLPELPDDVMGAGAGTEEIPFDQTAPEEPMASPIGAEALAQSPEDALPADPMMDEMPATTPADRLAAPGSEGGDTGDLSDVDLASMQLQPEQESGDDAAVAEMASALEDPTVDPNTKAIIQQQLDLAARRRLLGGGAELGV